MGEIVTGCRGEALYCWRCRKALTFLNAELGGNGLRHRGCPGAAAPAPLLDLRGFMAISGLWLAAGLLHLIFYFDFDLGPFLLSLLAGLAWLGCGLVLLVLALFGAGFKRRRWLALAVSMAIAGLQLGYVMEGERLALKLWLFRHRSRYQAVIAAVQGRGAMPSPRPQFEVDDASRDRVIFVLPGGLLDNWRGLAYDPTGALAKFEEDEDLGDLEAWEPRRSKPLRMAFGGVMTACHPLGDGWYFCWFT